MTSRIVKANINGTTYPIDLLYAPTPNGPSGNWNMVFVDEFNGTELDTTKWNVYYPTTGTGTLLSNITVADSVVAFNLSSTTEGATITSALLETNLASEFTPGVDFFRVQVGDYVEARCLFPGNGVYLYNWAAFWLSGLNWPANGEHDILETHNNATISYHYGTSSDELSNPNGYIVPGYWGDKFHILGLERGASTANVYYDGTLIKSYATSDSGGGQAIILGTGYNSAYTTKIGAGSEVLVDYVRVFRPA